MNQPIKHPKHVFSFFQFYTITTHKLTLFPDQDMMSAARWITESLSLKTMSFWFPLNLLNSWQSCILFRSECKNEHFVIINYILKGAVPDWNNNSQSPHILVPFGWNMLLRQQHTLSGHFIRYISVQSIAIPYNSSAINSTFMKSVMFSFCWHCWKCVN